ncbi:MAG: UDP-N-acetylmuramoyl-L-alanyl-D-glutamate--2,6-diaminopimelate ligase [Planctomycetota bacterium]|nr:UDP-N-acetylmuramoyl-L-alanyl-D-glutamate--2,6-diaminopimelate ligase [Planctomycetota bacterium]
MMAVSARPRTIADLQGLLEASAPVALDGSTPLTGLADDSRCVQPGSVFFARRGSQDDGARVSADARARGAAVVVTDQAPVEGEPALVVADVDAALRASADAWYGRPQDALELVGITGTKGKTTSGALTAAALGAWGRTLFGTIAHDLGAGVVEPSSNTTPGALELRRLLARARENGCDTAVLEVSSHALDQGRTVGLPFAVAAFTNLASDHLDYHGDPQAYFEAKARLFSGLAATGTAVLNREDASWSRLAARVQGSVLTYGFTAEADLRASDVVLAPDGTRFRLTVAGEGERDVQTPMVGKHNVLNILAALGACAGLGLDPMVAADGAAAVALVPGRLERVESRTDVQAFVDYAHTEDALRQVLVFLNTVGAVPVTCVVGCGGDRDRSKRPRMARVAVELAQETIFTSDNPRTEDPLAILADMTSGLSPEERERVTVIPDRAAAIEHAVRMAPPGATVLVAGKGHETYQIIGTEKTPFDDAAALREALAARAEAGFEGPEAWGASQA